MHLKNPHMTRRRFLKAISAAGGSTALWAVLDAWGLVRASQEEPPDLQGSGNGTRVIILGAGVGGMSSAYELLQIGYDVQILEARDRPGGRTWSVRQGTELNEIGGERQVCEFDEGLYANLGPWRIPHHHESLLHYLRTFNVPVEPFVNYQEANYVYVEGDFGPLAGRPIRVRQLKADMAGYTSELLAKVAEDGKLDAPLDQEQIDMLLDYLAFEGLVNRDTLEYTGTGRRGYENPPGAHDQPGVPLDPFPFQDILPYAAEIMEAQGYYLGAVAGFSQQMTMLQPVGGMDRIAFAFADQLGDRITYQSEVQEIRQSEDGVRIVYTNLTTGQTSEITGDYCLCNIPLTILTNIPADFSNDMAEAIRNVPYQSTGKIGLQFSRRFWEEDDQIYGGTTRTNIPELGDIAYPSYGFLGQKGVLQGYYNFGVPAIEISRLTPQERIEFALEQGSKIHPQYRETFENGFSVAWHRVPYNLGGWANYNDFIRNRYYPRLLEPDGRIYLVGEHLSYLTGWQAGAIESAWIQIQQLHQHVMQTQEG